jgi:hypothetical protein
MMTIGAEQLERSQPIGVVLIPTIGVARDKLSQWP